MAVRTGPRTTPIPFPHAAAPAAPAAASANTAGGSQSAASGVGAAGTLPPAGSLGVVVSRTSREVMLAVQTNERLQGALWAVGVAAVLIVGRAVWKRLVSRRPATADTPSVALSDLRLKGFPLTVRLGSCHCGATRFRVRIPEDVPALECDLATRGGRFVHVIVPAGQFELLTPYTTVKAYQQDPTSARHVFCTYCGVSLFQFPGPHADLVAVNVACLVDGNGRVQVQTLRGASWSDVFSTVTGGAHNLAASPALIPTQHTMGMNPALGLGVPTPVQQPQQPIQTAPVVQPKPIPKSYPSGFSSAHSVDSRASRARSSRGFSTAFREYPTPESTPSFNGYSELSYASRPSAVEPGSPMEPMAGHHSPGSAAADRASPEMDGASQTSADPMFSGGQSYSSVSTARLSSQYDLLPRTNAGALNPAVQGRLKAHLGGYLPEAPPASAHV